MSTFDRLTNLAKGAVADGRRRFDEGGGIDGIARKAGERARTVADAAREAAVSLQDGVAERTSVGTLAAAAGHDREWAAARSEVDAMRPARSRKAPPVEVEEESGLTRKLAALDRRHRSGAVSKEAWLSERAQLLDELDRSTRADKNPRRRTL